MANGSETTPGIKAEQELVKQLRELGYEIAVDGRLDHELKVDGIATAPPMPSGAFFYPPPIAIQVTTRIANWEKRIDCVAVARCIAPRIAYMELCGYEVTREMISATDAALRHLFYCKTSPQIALVEIGYNTYTCADLDDLLTKYRAWLRTIIHGRIHGEITFWRKDKKWGFISACVLGPNGVVEETQFFVHLNSTDLALSQRLDGSDGEVAIPVTFEDGRIRAEEVKRKTAVNVTLEQP